MATSKKIGTHLMADFDGVRVEFLSDRSRLTSILVGALETEGFQILQVTGHDFPGGGFTSLVLLAESHASLHSYPERQYLAFDLFSCGAKDPEVVLDSLRQALGPVTVRQTSWPRHSQGQPGIYSRQAKKH